MTEENNQRITAEPATLQTHIPPQPPTSPSEEALEVAKRMNPLDDLFFTKMAEDASVCEEVISTILNVKVKVLSVIPQGTIASLQGRSVRLDALVDALAMRVVAELLEASPIGEKGAKINIEVQKDNKDDYQRRVRFNASAITMNFTPPGTKKFRDIPDVVEIFISAFDVFKEGKVRYQIYRVIKGSGTVVYNGMTEVYVNTAVKDHSTPELDNISGLMELFATDGYDYEKFPNFSRRKHQFKETEEGVFEMGEEVQRLMDRERQEGMREGMQKGIQQGIQQGKQEGKQEGILEGKLEATVSHIKNVMAAIDVSAEKAMDMLGIPPSQRGTYTELIGRT